MSDQAKKQSGPIDALSRWEKKANKKRTHVVRRQFDQSYLDPTGFKSALVTGEGNEE